MDLLQSPKVGLTSRILAGTGAGYGKSRCSEHKSYNRPISESEMGQDGAKVTIGCLY